MSDSGISLFHRSQDRARRGADALPFAEGPVELGRDRFQQEVERRTRDGLDIASVTQSDVVMLIPDAGTNLRDQNRILASRLQRRRLLVVSERRQIMPKIVITMVEQYEVVTQVSSPEVQA